MSTFGASITTIQDDSNIFGNPLGYLKTSGNIWRPKSLIASKSEAMSFPLGAILFGSFFVLFLLSVLLVITSMVSVTPFISTKFSLFLVLLFGGFAGELLYARKLKNV